MRRSGLAVVLLGLCSCLGFDDAISRYDCTDPANCRVAGEPPGTPPEQAAEVVALIGTPALLTAGQTSLGDGTWAKVTANGAPVAGATVSFTISASSATPEILAGATATTDAEGLVRFPSIAAGRRAGTFLLQAKTAHSNTLGVELTVLPGPAKTVSVTLASDTILLHQAYVIQSISVADDFDNPLPNPTVSLEFPQSGPSFNCDGPGSNPLVSTVEALALPRSCWTNEYAGAVDFVVRSGPAATTVTLHQNIGPADRIQEVWPRAINFTSGKTLDFSFPVVDEMNNRVYQTSATFSASVPGSGPTCTMPAQPTFSSGMVNFSCTAGSTPGAFAIELTLTLGSHTSKLTVPAGVVSGGSSGVFMNNPSPSCFAAASPCPLTGGPGEVFAPLQLKLVAADSGSPMASERLSFEIVPSGVAHFDETGYTDYVEFAGSRAVVTTASDGTATSPRLVIDRSESFTVAVQSNVDGSTNFSSFRFEAPAATGTPPP